MRFRPDVIDLKPKAVVILAGTNDIAGNTGPTTNEEIEGNLAVMSELAHATTSRWFSRASLRSANITSRLPQTTARPMERIKAVNDWMKSYAASHGDMYLDYFSAMWTRRD